MLIPESSYVIPHSMKFRLVTACPKANYLHKMEKVSKILIILSVCHAFYCEPFFVGKCWENYLKIVVKTEKNAKHLGKECRIIEKIERAQPTLCETTAKYHWYIGISVLLDVEFYDFFVVIQFSREFLFLKFKNRFSLDGRKKNFP